MATVIVLGQLQNCPCQSGFDGQGGVALYETERACAQNHFEAMCTDFILSKVINASATFKNRWKPKITTGTLLQRRQILIIVL